MFFLCFSSERSNQESFIDETVDNDDDWNAVCLDNITHIIHSHMYYLLFEYACIVYCEYILYTNIYLYIIRILPNWIRANEPDKY